MIRDKDVLHTLFAEIGPRFANRPGGYVRIVKLGARKGDSAPVVVIELVEAGYTPSTPAAAPESAPAPVVEDSTPVVDDVEVSDDVETGSVEEAPAAADETVSDTADGRRGSDCRVSHGRVSRGRGSRPTRPDRTAPTTTRRPAPASSGRAFRRPAAYRTPGRSRIRARE